MSHGMDESAAAAVLASDIYKAKCAYYREPMRDWADTPHYLRSGYLELAIRTLRHLRPTSGTDPLFALATDLARAEFGGRR